MLDTHEIARELTAAGIAPAHADAITNAVRRAAEHDAAGIDVNVLATKADLIPLVTKDELKAALAPLVTKDELKVALAPFVTKDELKAALAPLVTKDELKAALAPFVTKDELSASLAALELRLVKWMIGVVFAGAGLVIAALRLMG